MIKTPICELFGIEYPIFQGGMAWVADASLAGCGLGRRAAWGSSRRDECSNGGLCAGAGDPQAAGR